MQLQSTAEAFKVAAMECFWFSGGPWWADKCMATRWGRRCFDQIHYRDALREECRHKKKNELWAVEFAWWLV